MRLACEIILALSGFFGWVLFFVKRAEVENVRRLAGSLGGQVGALCAEVGRVASVAREWRLAATALLVGLVWLAVAWILYRRGGGDGA